MGKITLYGRPGCPMVPPVQAKLDQSRAEYEYVDIYQDEAGRQRVREINDGNESVPTLVFPDGSTLTEPSAAELRAKLRAMGYDVPLAALLASNAHWIVVGLGVLIAVLSALGVF